MATTTKQEKALCYLRVSGKGQVEGHGFDRQREACAAYAEAHGLELAGEYRDEGVSGAKELENRPALAALLDKIEANGVRLVLVERADRLARDLLVGEIILGRFRDLGVRVIEADGGNELTVGDDDPTRKLIRQVLGAVSEFDKTVVVLKLRAARERVRADVGRCEGRKPFGTRAGERATVERILELRGKTRRGRGAMSLTRIGQVLACEGLASRSGRPWTAQSVNNVVQRGRWWEHAAA